MPRGRTRGIHGENRYGPGGSRCARTQAGPGIGFGILVAEGSSHRPKPGPTGLS